LKKGILVNLGTTEVEFVSDEYQTSNIKNKDNWEEELKAELGAIEGSNSGEIDEAWEEAMKRELEGDNST